MVKKIFSICLILCFIISSIGCDSKFQYMVVEAAEKIVESTPEVTEEPEESIYVSFDKYYEQALKEYEDAERLRKEFERLERYTEVTNIIENIKNECVELLNKSNKVIENTITSDKITWIGDSYSVIAHDYIVKNLPNVDIYAKSAKHTGYGWSNNPSGISILKDLCNQNKVRKCLIFALGTNDSVKEEEFKGYIDEIMSLVPEDTLVIMFSVFTLNSYKNNMYDGVNKALDEAEQEYTNLKVARWKEIAEPLVYDYFSTNDGIHPNRKGMAIWVDLLIKTARSH